MRGCLQGQRGGVHFRAVYSARGSRAIAALPCTSILIAAGRCALRWRESEEHRQPSERRLHQLTEQCADVLDQWTATSERHAHAVTELESRLTAWHDMEGRLQQDASARFQGLERTVERLRAYRDAGASCLFAPGVYDRGTITKLVKAVEAPLNILANPTLPPVAELEKIGVARVSAGSGLMRAAMGVVQRVAKEVLKKRSFESIFVGATPYVDLNRMMQRRANPANA